MVPLKYPSNLWKTYEMSLINCKINFDLNCSKKCVKLATAVADQDATFSINDTKFYTPVVMWSTQDNVKLLDQLKSVFFLNEINRNKYQSKVSTERSNQCLDNLIDPTFQFCFIIWK